MQPALGEGKSGRHQRRRRSVPERDALFPGHFASADSRNPYAAVGGESVVGFMGVLVAMDSQCEVTRRHQLRAGEWIGDRERSLIHPSFFNPHLKALEQAPYALNLGTSQTRSRIEAANALPLDIEVQLQQTKPMRPTG